MSWCEHREVSFFLSVNRHMCFFRSGSKYIPFPPSQVLPELQSPKINDNPVLKADAIKFVTTFR